MDTLLITALFQGALGLSDYTDPINVFYGLYRIRKGNIHIFVVLLTKSYIIQLLIIQCLSIHSHRSPYKEIILISLMVKKYLTKVKYVF